MLFLRYVQLTVLPQAELCSFQREVKAKQSLALLDRHARNTASLKSSFESNSLHLGHNITDGGEVPQRHLGPTSYVVLISIIIASAMLKFEQPSF